MLTLILLMGDFILPAFLGGGKVFFIGNALVDLFLQSRNWPFGAAVAIALVVIMVATVFAYMRFVLARGERDNRQFCNPMRYYAAAIYLFLYFPIAIIVAYSFNEGRYAMDWQGFSLKWYAAAWNNPFVMEALRTSLTIAGGAAAISRRRWNCGGARAGTHRIQVDPADFRRTDLYRHYRSGHCHRHCHPG